MTLFTPTTACLLSLCAVAFPLAGTAFVVQPSAMGTSSSSFKKTNTKTALYADRMAMGSTGVRDGVDNDISNGRNYGGMNSGGYLSNLSNNNYNPNYSNGMGMRSYQQHRSMGNRMNNGYNGNYHTESSSLELQGGALQTWSFNDPNVETVRVHIESEGELDSEIDMWQGPNNAPLRLKVYSEDGTTHPVTAHLTTPYRSSNTVAVRNRSPLVFPCTAGVMANAPDSRELLMQQGYRDEIVQGGALRSFYFDPYVESVQVMLQTDGRPLHARIELLQGPNNNKQVLDVYTDDGIDRPLQVVLQTPGSDNVVRVLNKSTLEFPLGALVEPYRMSPGTPANYNPYQNRDYQGNRRWHDYSGRGGYGGGRWYEDNRRYGGGIGGYGSGSMSSYGSRYGNRYGMNGYRGGMNSFRGGYGNWYD